MTNTLILDGNLTRDPELRYTEGGHAVANITVAHTPRIFNKTSGEYEDGETLFLRGSLWRQAAENAAETYRQGQAVLVTGELKQRSYEKDGEKHTVFELDVKNIGPSTLRAIAEVTKNEPKNAQSGGRKSSGGSRQKSRQAARKDEPETVDDESPF